ncbi:MAG: chemotaxis protein CheW [Nevskiales bacterium]|nr:chemotaxis protein CheW [Nevskiales bacterium]
MTAVATRRKDDTISRWVCFETAGQHYGLPILSVQEVLRDAEIEPVPGTSEQVLGVINLRGNVVTVLDLRRRLSLEPVPRGPESRIVIVDHDGESYGLMVDRVADVRKVIDLAVKAAPSVGPAPGQSGVSGVYVRDGDLLTLLDPAALIDNARFLP